MINMKALTVKQPYAYLICAGIKDIENRAWKTNFRGCVLIHAGCTIVQPAFEIEGQATIHEIQFAKAVNVVEGKNLISAIIGSIEIVDCVRNHPSAWAEKDKWNWVLANPVLFKTPVRDVRGKLSFWEFDSKKLT
jgi:hypothetical protein